MGHRVLARLKSPTRGAGDRSQETPTSRGVGVVLDFASDWAVLAFATWTLIAYGGMATRAPVDVLTPIWLVTLPVLFVALVLLSRARVSADDLPLVPPAEPLTPQATRAPIVSLAAGGVAAAAAVAGLPWLLAWAFAVVSVAVAVVWWWRGQTGGELSPAQASGAHAFAAATGLGLAVLSLFLHRVNADDVF